MGKGGEAPNRAERGAMKEELTTQGIAISDKDQQEAIEATSGIVVPGEGLQTKTPRNLRTRSSDEPRPSVQ